MNDNHPFLVLELPCEDAITWLSGRLVRSGLILQRTFDLRAASGVQVDCACSHHGTDLCDCQMVVLLVYGESARPASLVAHAHNGKTFIALVDNPQQPADRTLETTLKEYLCTRSAQEAGKQLKLQDKPQAA
ncbi:MAG TPA: hypothetical protein VJ436_00605 [Anaerolineales bacterium]|nr:hypothetical protein [Anaerolineales bacterium]